jgi:hypothetical protein
MLTHSRARLFLLPSFFFTLATSPHHVRLEPHHHHNNLSPPNLILPKLTSYQIFPHYRQLPPITAIINHQSSVEREWRVQSGTVASEVAHKAGILSLLRWPTHTFWHSPSAMSIIIRRPSSFAIIRHPHCSLQPSTSTCSLQPGV